MIQNLVENGRIYTNTQNTFDSQHRDREYIDALPFHFEFGVPFISHIFSKQISKKYFESKKCSGPTAHKKSQQNVISNRVLAPICILPSNGNQ